MLWWTMSAVATSSRAMRSPSGCLRSMAMSRLPRWQPRKGPTTFRMPSPRVGSTLMTSAPRSASSIGPNGPARYWPKSTTRTPSSGPGTSYHPPGPQGGDLALVVPEGREHLVGVLPGHRLRALHLSGRGVEEQRYAHLRQGPRLGVGDLDHRAGGLQLGMVEPLVRGDDRLGVVPGGTELGDQLVPVPGQERRAPLGLVAGPLLGSHREQFRKRNLLVQTEDRRLASRRLDTRHRGRVDPRAVGALVDRPLVDAGVGLVEQELALVGPVPVLGGQRHHPLQQGHLHVLTPAGMFP